MTFISKNHKKVFYLENIGIMTMSKGFVPVDIITRRNRTKWKLEAIPFRQFFQLFKPNNSPFFYRLILPRCVQNREALEELGNQGKFVIRGHFARRGVSFH